MKHEYPSTDDASRTADSFADESRPAVDEKRLYGEPCHERGERRDEQSFYGKPQHESYDSSEAREIELLFARMQSVPVDLDARTSRQ